MYHISFFEVLYQVWEILFSCVEAFSSTNQYNNYLLCYLYVSILGTAFGSISILITLMSCERAFAVTHPHSYNSYVTISLMKKVAALTVSGDHFSTIVISTIYVPYGKLFSIRSWRSSPNLKAKDFRLAMIKVD